ncbi:Pentatricopeptide repeat-containing protein, mitochondrial [Ananas comosus]|uniref:Pentatricopeptide repeat-containing protein, mitochondrial n=1 Tax=Ananas comosus TaxID=4615 RepID=A0A199V4S1_ANACO|nr:Pentatricopeptide repeat-containing protein, mitochondrial [Ananas comosus]
MTLPPCRTVAVTPSARLNFPRIFLRLLTSPLSPAPFPLPPSLQSLHLAPQYRASPPSPSPPENPLASFIASLKNPSPAAALSDVELLHSRAIKVGFARNRRVGAGLLNQYVKIGSLGLARKLFEEIPNRDVPAWTVLISGYSRNGRNETGLQLFHRMLDEGVPPNGFTLSSVLKCCAGISDVENGKRIHGWIVRNGIVLDVVLHNSILDMYTKCGTFKHVKRYFHMMMEKDSVSWNIMIAAHLEIGDIDGSMDLFAHSPFQDVSSWNTIVSGLVRNGFDEMALKLLDQMVRTGPRELHNRILRIGYEQDAYVTNSLIDMYCKCNQMEASSIIFNSSSLFATNSTAKTISWSTMMAGFVQSGRNEEALELFLSMQRGGVTLDQFTLTSCVTACADAGILEQGRQKTKTVLSISLCPEKLPVVDLLTEKAVTVAPLPAFSGDSKEPFALLHREVPDHALPASPRRLVQHRVLDLV